MPEDNTTEIIIRKQRNGPTGTVKLTFDLETTSFEDQTRDEVPPGVGESTETDVSPF